MERLTRSANDGAYTYTACEATIGEILNRLTEYEDTGMTPEEIEDMKWNNEWQDARSSTPGSPGEYWVTIDEGGIRTAQLRTFRGEWIVGPSEIVEAWMPVTHDPEPYERRENSD